MNQPSLPQDGAKPTPAMRVAAEYRWAHPNAPWAEVADSAGCHRNTLERWRDTDAWNVAVIQAGAQHVEDLAPAAIAGLRKCWLRGNPAGAIEVLKALGILRPPPAAEPMPVRFSLNIGTTRSLDEEIEEIVRELRPDYPQ